MATYNRSQFIVESLQTIQNQTYTNWECLIIDDGGIDNTLEVITPFLEKDTRFQFLKRPNNYEKGISGCRNYGLDLAQGNYIIFFDDDDIVHPQNLEICLSVLKKNQQLSFCNYKKESFENSFNYMQINKIESYNGKFVENDFLEKMITNEISIASCTVLWKKDCFDKIRFNEFLRYAEEWECFQRIFSKFNNGILINESLYFNRKHPNSNTSSFYKKNPLQLASKKEAIKLVEQNLVNKRLLNMSILKYFVGNAISFRDLQFLNDILNISNETYSRKLYFKLKFYIYPIWKIYKRMLKTIGK